MTNLDAPVIGHGRWDFTPLPTGGPRWPGGKRLAVYVALGLEDYRFGEGETEDLLPGVPQPDLVNASWRDYGNRVGAFRLIDRLQSLGISPAILLNTALYDSAPDLLALARKVGAEIVGHGISNSDSLAGLGESEESRYLQAVADRIEREESTRPLGWSSPWLTQTANTLELLVDNGYRYVLDLRLDDHPVRLNTSRGELLAMPYALELNDSSSIVGRGVSASEFADMIIDEFDELLAAAEDQSLVMSIVVHSFISGAPFRLRQLTRALAHIAQHSQDVWLTQPRHIYAALQATR
ncbi:hypothetical protein ABIB25_002547 [Nakamurella sp. UYEF19]|uniref:polysaccharide deacetylase family protein n=1 Tax=Nakamurella sp. UYEF19 TaxID=1756392 RepID=UPI003391292F